MDSYIEKVVYNNPIISELVWVKKPWKRYSRSSSPSMGWGIVVGVSFLKSNEENRYERVWDIYFYGEVIQVRRNELQRFLWYNRHLVNVDGSPKIPEESDQ